jgi:hypothetical protein
VDADLLGELSLVEPGVPELTNELIDLGLVATPARALDVMHPSPSPGSKQFGNHGVHRTLTKNPLIRPRGRMITTGLVGRSVSSNWPPYKDSITQKRSQNELL